MSTNISCGDPALLAGYVYDDCEPGEREAMQMHVATCVACAREVEDLRGAREQLSSWTPPDIRLGFRVVSEPAVSESAISQSAQPSAPNRRRSWTSWSWPGWSWAAMPAWAQAAAAVMLFACGAGVAALMNLEVRYDTAGLTLRTGWQRPARATSAAAVAPVAASAPTALDVAALDTRIRDAIKRVHDEEAPAAVRPEQVASTQNASTQSASIQSSLSPDDVLRRVKDMLNASEQRQQHELALRLSQVIHDVDSQRRADIARIERTVSPMEGLTAEEMQQQRKVLNYLMTVSQTK